MTPDATSHSGLGPESLSALHLAGIALAVVSGLLHLFLGVSLVSRPIGLAFLFAGVGFFAGSAAVVAWYLINATDFSGVGFIDKAGQVGLVALLVILYRRES